MSEQLAEKRLDFEPAKTARISRSRLAFIGAAALVVLSILYAASNLLGIKENFLFYVANVLSPMALIALLVLFALQALQSRLRGRHSTVRSSAVFIRVVLLIALLVPVVQGELRRGTLVLEPAQLPRGEFTLLDANLFGPTNIGDDLLQEIARRDPDIILLQELTPPVERRLTALLGIRYPCQVLNPQVGTTGMGIYAKFPCTERQRQQQYFAAGLPQFVELKLPTDLHLVVANVHTNPPHVIPDSIDGEGLLSTMGQTVSLRERHAENLLVELSRLPADGQIVAGDFNATIRNRVYDIMVRRGMLQDVWSGANPLIGGTWPNTSVSALSWLVRLDFVFHSESLLTLLAENLDTAGGSDHRGIFVRFGWAQPPSR